MSIEYMHNTAGLLSLEQRRPKQVLCLMFIHKQRFTVARIHQRITRAAGVFSFVRERYNCTKYKNSPYYKGAILWDGLPVHVRNCTSLLEFKKYLKVIYRKYNSIGKLGYIDSVFVVRLDTYFSLTWAQTLVYNRRNNGLCQSEIAICYYYYYPYYY